MDTPLGIDDICKLIGGKPADLARLLEVSDAAISQWRDTGFPPGRALELERKLDGKVRASEIKVAVRPQRKAKRARAAA
jgi:DNA-binding transcriptional regulator YdaS (Cro superfamily)